jgi:hypothetical protein
MIRNRISYSLALCLPFTLVACHKDGADGGGGAPVDPVSMSQQAADRAAEVLHSTAAAMQGNRSLSAATSDASDGVGTMVRVFRLSGSDSVSGTGGGPTTTPTSPGTDVPPGGVKKSDPNWGELTLAGVQRLAGVLAGNRRQAAAPAPDGVVLTAATSDNSDLSDQLDMQADDVRKVIHDRLLAETNLESKSDSEAIYLLHADPTCRSIKDDSIDQKCVEQLPKLQIRLRLTRQGEGAEVGLLFGPARLHPASVFVQPNQLAVELYLAPLKDTILFASAALGEMAPELPATMRGTLRASLTKDGPKRATAAVAVLADIEFADGDVTIRTAATNPALAFTADGDARSITGKVNIARTEVIVPWTPTERVVGAKADIVLGGLTGETTFTDMDKQIVLKRLGLGDGPSYLDVIEGGATKRIVQADLNPQDGRTFDLGITFDAQNQPRITLTPRVDFSLMSHFDLVAPDFDKAPPSFLLDETYRLQLTPAGGSSVVLAPFTSGVPGEEGGIRVVSGQFSLGSNKVAMPVTAAAGQCIVGTEPPTGSHPLLGGLKVVACP